jgi:cell division initiation protein
MKITPVDIHHKEFSHRIWGLSKNEVNEFLHEVSSQLESLTLERNQLKESLREKDMTLLEYKERDKVLSQTIATASQMAEKMNLEAQKEAMNIKKEAELKAEQMLQETREQLKFMYKEIMDLKRMRLQFEANMKSLAQAHIDLIEKVNITHDGQAQVTAEA